VLSAVRRFNEAVFGIPDLGQPSTDLFLPSQHQWVLIEGAFTKARLSSVVPTDTLNFLFFLASGANEVDLL
jgi:hypothetical protein